MALDTPLVELALLLGLSLFFGLAFEELYGDDAKKPPGGIRTFPLLALSGALLYRLDRERLLPFVAGLIVLGAWLLVSYRERLREPGPAGGRDFGIVAPVCNVLAYLIGPVALVEPHWLAVGAVVAAVLLLTSRERLHAIAHRVAPDEIVTAGKFLILTGIVLPLLPDVPVTSFSPITPYKAWLALLAVCTISYASYLLQRFIVPAKSDLAVAVLGGLYSSTATTVVLAREARADPDHCGRAAAGIVIATALMYVRILAIVAVFDRALALALAPAALALFAVGVALAAWLYWRARDEASAERIAPPRNPLELAPAVLFATLFVVISLLASWAEKTYGSLGLNILAAVVGVTDVDPFVLNLAQGGAALFSVHAAAVAILIAIASNNVLKAGYAVAFIGLRPSVPAVAPLVLLAAATVGFASILAGG